MHLFGRRILRAAEMQWLTERPMQSPDRLGRYASLYLEEQPEGAVALCLLDRKYRFLSVHLLTSGPKVNLVEYAPRIPVLFHQADAAYAVLLFAPRAAQYGYTVQDEQLAFRFALYCKRQKIELIECIVAWMNGYVALLREYDHHI